MPLTIDILKERTGLEETEIKARLVTTMKSDENIEYYNRQREIYNRAGLEGICPDTSMQFITLILGNNIDALIRIIEA